MESSTNYTMRTDFIEHQVSFPGSALKMEGIDVVGDMNAVFEEILTPEALRFVAKLERKFSLRRVELLDRRNEIQEKINNGHLPHFLPETKDIRNSEWHVAPHPHDLDDRRVEITGPVERKMIINALNSGSKVFMADFEDSNSPTWSNVIDGQINLRDAVNRTISFTKPDGKQYTLNDETATLVVRPRGWHLEEKQIIVDGSPISASILDFGLYFYHNVKELLQKGTGPYYYLPKLENHLEARLWNDVFVMAQEELDIPVGTIKATVLIETILAAFEMDEILYELRDHSTGLNCGRWDYIFSFIKKFRNRSDCILPDRAEVTMQRHFMKSYVDLLIKTCHRRGAHAVGGMAAQIPIKQDLAANKTAIGKVREDKDREVKAGHDGTWVAHPGLISIALDAFDAVMTSQNQLNVLREEVSVSAEDLLKVPQGNVTEDGIRTNIRVGIHYLESWLRGNGCVPLYYLMEDAATAEICRSQLWQWIHHNAKMNDGRSVTVKLFKEMLAEELDTIEKEVGSDRFRTGKHDLATDLFTEMITTEEFDDFLTIPAYEHI